MADRDNSRISVFQCDGQFSHNIGSDQLRSPSDVAVTNNNQLLVTDKSNCISIFTIDGNYVGKIVVLDSHVQLSGQLAVDKRGFIMVTYHNYVSIFDKDGAFYGGLDPQVLMQVSLISFME